MTEWLPPGGILVVGGLVVPFLPRRLRAGWLVLLPLLGLVQVLLLPTGFTWSLQVAGLDLQLVRVDALSRIFGIIFHIAAILSAIFALQVRDPLQQVSGAVYAGSAIGAAFVGDLLSLFVFWELTAVSSLLLVWARGGKRARDAGFRYLVIQLASGVLLIAGTALHHRETGSIEFGLLGLRGPGTVLIFLAFGMKAAFPLLHVWLKDAYPESTESGTVFLSVFTTKLAIYALARGFAGTEILVPIGAAMTAFPVFFALIENDLRRVLSYSLTNQLGFMIVGIGMGTDLAINGTVAHAFAHIIYKALLFMSMGAVLRRAGTTDATELGGLYRCMPWTTAFCIIGAASISGFPLLSGFVSKSMILTAAAEEHRTLTLIVLLFASAGVLDHSGIKVPYFAFFAHYKKWQVREAPGHMLLAMGLAAALCIGLGVYPYPLYALLPHAMSYDPFTMTHVVTTLQLLVCATLAFSFLMRIGIYPPEMRGVNLDADWLYRKAAPAAIAWAGPLARGAWAAFSEPGRRLARSAERVVARYHAPKGVFGEPWPTGRATMWAAILLVAFLVVYYF